MECVNDPAEDGGLGGANRIAADNCHDDEFLDAERGFLVAGVAMWFDKSFDLGAKRSALFDGVFSEFGFVPFVGFMLVLFIVFSLVVPHAVEFVLLLFRGLLKSAL